MANKTQFKSSPNERQMRYFSESFKQDKVREIEKNLTRVSDLAREYELTRNSIYKWINKYSNMKKKGIRQVIETESDTKKLMALQEKVKELERIIGQKQIMIDFKDKMIEIAEELYHIDIKKKFGSAPSSGSGSTETSTGGN
jgi:transposase-like protein